MAVRPDRALMEVLGAAVARARRDRLSDARAVRHADAERAVDYRRFCTTAWKTGNFLRNEGVRSGAEVVVADDPSPLAVTTLYGASLLGATVAFGTDAVTERTRALVGPTARVVDLGLGPRTRVVAYGSDPGDSTVAYFERDVWSENPTEPPDVVAPGDDLLRTGGRTYSHADVLAEARAVGETYDFDAETAVAVRAPFAEPRTVFAGLVAPLVAGGTVLLPDADDVGDVAVGGGAVPEVRLVEV